MAAADTIRFICPGCGYRARIPASFTGKVILCPGCQQVQIASSDHGEPSGDTVSVSRVATASAKELTAQVSVPDASGKIRFTCAKCGFHAKLASSYAGKAIACPGCQAPQLIPPLGSAPVAATAAAAAAATATAADRPSTTPTVAAPVLSDEPGISFDEPMASELAPAERPASQAAPAAPAPRSAPKPAAPSRPSTPSPPSSRSLGVVRRGVREAPPGRGDPGETEEGDEPEAAPAKAPSAAGTALAPLIGRLKEPKVLGLAIACLVALILEICLIVSWRGAVAEADKYRASSKQAEDQLKDAKSALSHAEYDRDELTSKLKAANDQLKKAQDDLGMAQKAAQDAGEKYKAAEAERQKEYDERKQAVAQYDDAFAKLKKSELAREEDYKRRLEAEKARDEEARLRKELKGKLDELAKTPK
jgi:hypothetical protein